VSSTPTTINRRWFLKVGAAFALMPATTSGQVPIERGRFSDDYLPLARQQLLDLVNTERSQTGLSTLELDDLVAAARSISCEVNNPWNSGIALWPPWTYPIRSEEPVDVTTGRW